jgi:hypothetical protein
MGAPMARLQVRHIPLMNPARLMDPAGFREDVAGIVRVLDGVRAAGSVRAGGG